MQQKQQPIKVFNICIGSFSVDLYQQHVRSHTSRYVLSKHDANITRYINLQWVVLSRRSKNNFCES